MKFLRSLLEAKTKRPVDITQKPNRNAISAAWPEGVMYKGINVFNTVYDTDLPDRFQLMLKYSAEGEDISSFDAQESYLGFSPSKDVFVMGFDTWGERYEGSSYAGDEDTERGRDGLDEHGMAADIPNVVAFRLDEEGGVYQARVLNLGGRMMYGPNQTLPRLKQRFPDLIDIRLD